MTVLTEQRATTWDIDLEDLGNINARTALYFTLKRRLSDADDDAMVKIEETVGLQVINGDAAGTPGNGSITVTDAVAGDITIALAVGESAKLGQTPMAFYDVKVVTATGVSVLTSDRFNVTRVVTEAIA